MIVYALMAAILLLVGISVVSLLDIKPPGRH